MFLETSRCRLRFEGKQYDGWVYYPHPETKVRHFQNSALIEIIAEEITGIEIGDVLKVGLNPAEVAVMRRYTPSKPEA